MASVHPHPARDRQRGLQLREMAADQRVHLGQAEEGEELAKDPEDPELGRVPAEERPSEHHLLLQVRHLPVPFVRQLLPLRRRDRSGGVDQGTGQSRG